MIIVGVVVLASSVQSRSNSDKTELKSREASLLSFSTL